MTSNDDHVLTRSADDGARWDHSHGREHGSDGDFNHKHGSDGSHPISGPTLMIEPVINFVPGVGATADSFPLYDPEFVNPATGEHPFLANEPGEIDTYAAGFPPDAELLTLSANNNTNFDITSLKMKIIGSANDLIPGVSWTITRGAHVNAVFGDVNGDGKIGISNIFSKISVSDDGKTLVLSGGESHRTVTSPTRLSQKRLMACPLRSGSTEASTAYWCVQRKDSGADEALVLARPAACGVAVGSGSAGA